MAEMSELPDFDPRAYCEKCGNFNQAPIQDNTPKLGPRGADGNPIQLPPAPPQPPPPPTTLYCNGTECPWAEDEDPKTEPVTEEHMHQWCDVCGYEWLSQPLNQPRPDIEAEEKKAAENPPKIETPKAPAQPAKAPAKKALPKVKPGPSIR